MKLNVFQVDAFTDKIFSGNPAGVVLNADTLSDIQMQQIARELNNSETAFIINEKTDEYDIRVRFFTPTKEVPICGHATISAHYVYAKANRIKNGRIIQKTGAGILPVDIEERDDDLMITMTQGKIEFGDILCEKQKEKLIHGLNINPDDLDISLPIQIVSTGHSKVMIPIKNKETIDRMVPKNDVLSELSEEIKCNGFYVFSFDSEEEGILTTGRMFAPAIGINEDPITGNANGPLGAYLVKYGYLENEEKSVNFTAKQGESINRKGYVNVEIMKDGKIPQLVKISGKAKIVFNTIIEIN